MNTPIFLATLTSCQEAWRADKLPYVVFKTKGVPQGSILEPMLFLLFVNDLSDVVQHCTVNRYADDTTIYSTDENPVVLGARMEKHLESVAEWPGDECCENSADGTYQEREVSHGRRS